MRRLVGCVLTAALLATTVACTGKGGEIVIGVVGPLSGPNAFVGQAQQRGAELAADEINGDGGVGGRKIRLSIQDDSEFARITGILRDLTLRQKAVAIIGPETATPVLAASSPTARAQVPVLLPYASLGDVRPRPGRGPVFRLVPSAVDQATKLADWLVRQRRLTSVALATSSDESGRGAKELLTEAIVAAGGRVSGARDFTPGEVDQTLLAQNLRRSNASALVVWGPPPDAARVAQAVRRISWDVQVAGPSALFVSDYRSLAGAASEGTAISFPFRRDWFSLRVGSFFLKYQSKFGLVTLPRQRTLIPDLPVIAMASYDAVKLVAEAVKRGGTSGPKVAKTLEGFRNVQGLGTSYTFGPSDHEAFSPEDMWMARFYNFATLYDIDERADRDEQIAFYKIQVSAIYLPPEYFDTDKGSELQQRVLEDVLTNPEKVEFFKAYRDPRPAPGPI
jgi:branched-chain amino acid transport system substrate-binding protein